MQLPRLPIIFAAITLSWAMTLSPAEAHTPAEAMAQAAQSFLASLSQDQQQAAQFKFDDDERLNWQFIPMKRAGLSLKQMKPYQQQLAFGLLNSALSHRGTSKALNIMALEQILAELENNPTRRDAALYHFFIFGEPSTKNTWGFRIEGHHLSVSITLVDGQKIVRDAVILRCESRQSPAGPAPRPKSARGGRGSWPQPGQIARRRSAQSCRD